MYTVYHTQINKAIGKTDFIAGIAQGGGDSRMELEAAMVGHWWEVGGLLLFIIMTVPNWKIKIGTDIYNVYKRHYNRDVIFAFQGFE